MHSNQIYIFENYLHWSTQNYSKLLINQKEKLIILKFCFTEKSYAFQLKIYFFYTTIFHRGKTCNDIALSDATIVHLRR